MIGEKNIYFVEFKKALIYNWAFNCFVKITNSSESSTFSIKMSVRSLISSKIATLFGMTSLFSATYITKK